MYLTAMDELAECIETCQGCHITCWKWQDVLQLISIMYRYDTVNPNCNTVKQISRSNTGLNTLNALLQTGLFRIMTGHVRCKTTAYHVLLNRKKLHQSRKWSQRNQILIDVRKFWVTMCTSGLGKQCGRQDERNRTEKNVHLAIPIFEHTFF